MTKSLDRRWIEAAAREAERALKAGHPDTRAGRFNPTLARAGKRKVPAATPDPAKAK